MVKPPLTIVRRNEKKAPDDTGAFALLGGESSGANAAAAAL